VKASALGSCLRAAKLPCLLAAFLIVLAAPDMHFARYAARASAAPPAGDFKPVEPADIKNLVAQNKGKVVLLNFFATWCVPCHTEFPDIVKLQNTYKDQGLQVIEVSMNDISEKDELQKYLDQTKPPFTVYIAANTEDKFYTDVDPRWDTALPMTMIFDRDGKNVHFYKEARTFDQFKADVAPLLAAK
jgi:thiol-disulfide isomerase/thioredoxin